MTIIAILAVGVLSCVCFDIWQRLLVVLFKIPTSNWAIVGRWLVLGVTKGLWLNPNLISFPAFPNELKIGWVFHYFVAIIYAIIFFLLAHFFESVEFNWLSGLIFGMLSVIVPWFFFMPATGSGFLALRSENPTLACFLAFCAHSVFGLAMGIFFGISYI